MKQGLLLSLALLFMVAPSAKLRAELPKAVRVLSAACFKAQEKGTGADKAEYWAFKIALDNASGKDLSDLEVRYRIYAYTELNPDKSSASPVSFTEWKLPVAALKKAEKTTLTTGTMEFKFNNDSRPPALKVKYDRDIFQGIWVRVFDKSGKELGSFMKPKNLAKPTAWP